MAIPVILSRGGISVYPATIPEAIIDPETGLPAQLGGADVEYTINNQSPDENGNFSVTAESIGAALTGHTHSVADINSLQDELDGKSASDHTHTMVRSISVGGSSVTGDVVFQGTGNVQLVRYDNVISIRVTPHTVDTTNSITSTDNEQYKVFIGTAEEWETFLAGTSVGENYIVFIRS